MVKVAKETREGKGKGVKGGKGGKGGEGGKGGDNGMGTPSGAGNKKLQHGIKSVFLLYLMSVRCCYKGIIVHLYFDVLGEPSGGKLEPMGESVGELGGEPGGEPGGQPVGEPRG